MCMCPHLPQVAHAVCKRLQEHAQVELSGEPTALEEADALHDSRLQEPLRAADAREPTADDRDLDGLGHVPHGRTHADYSPPLARIADARERGVYRALDAGLAAWAHSLAATAALPDTPRLQEARARYTAATEAAARQPPCVAFGDSVTARSRPGT